MDHTAHDDVLGRLLDKVASLEESNSRLAARVKSLEGRRGDTDGGVDHDDEPVSRRGLLKKVGGAVAAGVAGAAVGNALGATPAGAADGDPVFLGQDNFATNGTVINNGVSTATLASRGGQPLAVYAEQLGTYGIAVLAYAAGSPATAVEARTGGHFSEKAVKAQARPQGYGVHAVTDSGIAVLGEATQDGGYGLQVKGRAVFSRSGKVIISAGQISKIVPVYLTAASLVLATIQGNPGTWVKSVSLDVANGRFTIWLKKAAAVNVTVGWFVVN